MLSTASIRLTLHYITFIYSRGFWHPTFVRAFVIRSLWLTITKILPAFSTASVINQVRVELSNQLTTIRPKNVVQRWAVKLDHTSRKPLMLLRQNSLGRVGRFEVKRKFPSNAADRCDKSYSNTRRSPGPTTVELFQVQGIPKGTYYVLKSFRGWLRRRSVLVIVYIFETGKLLGGLWCTDYAGGSEFEEHAPSGL